MWGPPALGGRMWHQPGHSRRDSELEGRWREARGTGSDHVPFRTKPDMGDGREGPTGTNWCPRSTEQSPKRKSSELVTDAQTREAWQLPGEGKKEARGPHLGSAKRQQQGDPRAQRRNASVRPSLGECQRDTAAMKDTSPDTRKEDPRKRGIQTLRKS